MRSLGVVFDPPCFDDAPRVRHGEEPVLVEALISEPAVEAFYVSVVHRFSGSDEVQPHAVLVCPGIEDLAFELRAVVDGDGYGKTTQGKRSPKSSSGKRAVA